MASILTQEHIAQIDALLVKRRAALAEDEARIANIQQNIDQLKSGQKMWKRFAAENMAEIAKLEKLRGL